DGFVLFGHFSQTFPPILAVEIIGDLAKEVGSGTPPERMVAALAGKFIGTGSPVSWDFRTLALGNLQGSPIEMTGQIYVQSARRVPDPEGPGYGMFIDVSPTNEAIIRWARGAFTEEEREFSARWRRGLGALGIETMDALLEERRVLLRDCSTIEEAGRLA